MLWYTREASVAVYVSNLPMIWPLLREWFPILRSMTPGQKLSSSNNKYGKDNSRRGATNLTGRQMNSTYRGKRLSDTGIITTIRGKGESTEELSSADETEMGIIERKESWERRSDNADIGLSERGMKSGVWDGGQDLKDGIQIQTTVQVVENYIGEAVTSPIRSHTPRSDLEKGEQGNYQWDFQKGERK